MLNAEVEAAGEHGTNQYSDSREALGLFGGKRPSHKSADRRIARLRRDAARPGRPQPSSGHCQLGKSAVDMTERSSVSPFSNW